MTTRLKLQRTARLGLLVKVVAMAPAVVSGVVTLANPNGASAFVSWCISYWWLLLVMGTLTFVVTDIVVAQFLRCPRCEFRLGRAFIPGWALAATSFHIRFCAHCGHALDEVTSRT